MKHLYLSYICYAYVPKTCLIDLLFCHSYYVGTYKTLAQLFFASKAIEVCRAANLPRALGSMCPVGWVNLANVILN